MQKIKLFKIDSIYEANKYFPEIEKQVNDELANAHKKIEILFEEYYNQDKKEVKYKLEYWQNLYALFFNLSKCLSQFYFYAHLTEINNTNELIYSMLEKSIQNNELKKQENLKLKIEVEALCKKISLLEL